MIENSDPAGSRLWQGLRLRWLSSGDLQPDVDLRFGAWHVGQNASDSVSLTLRLNPRVKLKTPRLSLSSPEVLHL